MLMLHSSMKYDQLMNILRFEIAGDVEGTTYIPIFSARWDGWLGCYCFFKAMTKCIVPWHGTLLCGSRLPCNV